MNLGRNFFCFAADANLCAAALSIAVFVRIAPGMNVRRRALGPLLAPNGTNTSLQIGITRHRKNHCKKM
jgi:hypothetical protein